MTYDARGMTPLAQWINDWRWAMNARQARRWRRELSFSARERFDHNLRPFIDDQAVIDYPDALYHITADDVIRAMMAATDLHLRV